MVASLRAKLYKRLDVPRGLFQADDQPKLRREPSIEMVASLRAKLYERFDVRRRLFQADDQPKTSTWTGLADDLRAGVRQAVEVGRYLQVAEDRNELRQWSRPVLA